MAQRPRRAVELGNRVAGFDDRALERANRRVELAAGLVAKTLKPARGAVERVLAAFLAGEILGGAGERLAQPFAIHQEGALRGERRLFALLGIERPDLRCRVAQE